MATRRKAAQAVESGRTNAVEAGTTPRPPVIKSKFSGVPMGWESAAQALPTISAVRTIFPDFNLRCRVGGLPSERVVVVHGATHGGKTAAVIGFIASFLLGGHAVAYVDAEHSTPREYMAQLVEQVTGTPLDQLGGFFAKRPKNYEDTITDVDRFLHFMKEQRKGNPELRALIVVDSLNELTPKRELEQMLKGLNSEAPAADEKVKKGPRGGRDKAGDNIDKGWGRVRAQLNAAWLSHLIPRLAEAGCTLVAIAQEKEGEEKEVWEQDLMDEYELLGGKKQKYAASMLLRVVKVRPVKEGEGREAEVLSWEHRVRIWKSKVGPMEGRWTDCTFYLRLDGSFDVARNLIHTGKELGVITKSSAESHWLSFGGVRVNGEKALVARLEKDAALLEKLTAAVNAAVDAELAKRTASKLSGHEDELPVGNPKNTLTGR